MLAALLALVPTAAASAQTRPVLLVGNNWDGTADVLDVPSYERLKRLNIVPDLQERLAENVTNPVRLGAFLFIRAMIGEGHDQMVDDLYTSNDGRTIFVSRPSFADVVAIDIASGKIVWRRPMKGSRADHMAISPDGKQLAVSDQNIAGDQQVDIIDTATGSFLGHFPSGVTPHENNYSRDGSLIFHASIGRVFTPLDAVALDATKGERWFQVVDAKTLKILQRVNIADKLAEAGYPDMSSAVRPMALSPDEKFVYLQVSFFHGFVEYDLQQHKVTRVAQMPVPPDVAKLRRDEYILDSAHHGIAMNGAGTKLCVAGTMSDYAAIVDRKDFSHRIHELGARTYWSTTSADGKRCYVSVAGDNTLSVIDYETEKEIARVPVGYHPQRARTGFVSTEIFGAPPAQRLRAKGLTLRAKALRGRRVQLSGRLAGVPRSACRGRVVVQLRRGLHTAARASATLSRSCRFSRRLRVAKGGRLLALARFAGTSAVYPQRSPGARIRVR